MSIAYLESGFADDAVTGEATHSRFGLRLGIGMLNVSILLSWIVFFEPAPTDVVFFGAFVLLVLTGQLLLTKDALWLHLGSLGFITANIVSAFVAKELTQSIRAMAINGYMLMLLYVFMSLVLRYGVTEYTRLTKLYFIATVISAAVGLAAYFRLFPGNEVFFRAEYGIRLKGLFKDPNVFGPYLVSGLMLGLSLSFSHARLGWFQLAAFLLLGLTILVTFSRGAWVNLVVSISVLAFFIIWLSPHQSQRNALLLTLFFGVPLLGGVCFITLSYFELLEYVVLRSQLQSYDVHRFDSQANALVIAARNPLGIGPGHYVGANHFANSDIYLASHNGFLKVLVENGWLGFASYCCILISFSISVARAMICKPHLRILLSGVIAVICGALVNSLVIDSLHWRHLFMVLGLGTGLALTVDSQDESRLQSTTIDE